MKESAVERKLTEIIVKELGGISVKLAPVEKGLPDRLILLPGGRIYLVELKADDGRVSKAQEIWHNRAEERGTTVVVLRGAGDVVRWTDSLKEET